MTALGTTFRPRCRLGKRCLTLALAIGLVSLALDGHASPTGRYVGPRWAPAPPSEPRDVAMGFQLDLFPTVISAVNGKVGYAPQVWAGIRPVRVRLIAAHLEPIDALTFDEEVIDPKLSVIAATVDYTFGDQFDGPWLGAGVESWQQQVTAANGSGNATWQSQVFTVGGGYIFRFADTFTVDPWLGIHTVMNAGPLDVGDVSYDPSPIALSGSVKVGWFFWAR